MLWENRESLRPFGYLSLQHTYAGITFGDNWVCAYKAHVDQTGAVFPYAWKFDFFKTVKQGTTPDRNVLQQIATKCWRAIDGGGEIDYSRFLVCLPQWACTTRETTVQMALQRDEATPDPADPVVENAHIEHLVNRIAASLTATDRNQVLVEVIPHYYVINGRRKMSKPVGTPAHSLKLKAHVTLAERSCVADIVLCLRQMGIRNVSTFFSPFSAIRPHLTLVERQRNVAIIEVDRKSICCSVYCKGELVRSGCIGQGSYNFLIETAHRLRTSPTDLADWLNEWEHVFVVPKKDGLPEQHTFSRFDDGPKSLEQLNAASADIGAQIVETILAKVRDANLKHRISIQDIVFMGDDYLSLRALKAAADAAGNVKARWRIPQGTHPGSGSRVMMPGLVRTFGALKLGNDLKLRPDVPVTREYNRTPVDQINGRIRAWGRRQQRRVQRIGPGHVARFLVSALSSLAMAFPFGRQGSRTSKNRQVTGRITLH